MSEETLRRKLVGTGKLLYQRGLVHASSGNISVKVKAGILIKSKGSRLGNLSQKDMVKVDTEGRAYGGTPSKELPMHLAVYQTNPAVRAVIHTHPTFTTTWSMTGKPLKPQTVEGRDLLGKVPIVGYAKPGSEKLARTTSKKLKGRKAVLLKGHGVVAVGKSLTEAFDIVELVEEAAKIEIISKLLKKR